MGITYHGHHNYSPDWSAQKGDPELYNLINDPQENFNVAGETANAEVRVKVKVKESIPYNLGGRGVEPNATCRVAASIARVLKSFFPADFLPINVVFFVLCFNMPKI